MPLEDPDQTRRPTRFQTLVIAACAKLDEILEAEERDQPAVAFGKKLWPDGARPPRLQWVHEGGSFTLSANALDPPIEEAPVPSLGFRVARAQCVIWHVSPEHAEHMLERLWLATTRIPGGEAFRWQLAVYDYPTELQGPWLKNGHDVLVVRLPIELAVAGSFDGEIETIEVTDTQLRTGIENPIGEDEDDTAYEVNSWVTPATTSE